MIDRAKLALAASIVAAAAAFVPIIAAGTARRSSSATVAWYHDGLDQGPTHVSFARAALLRLGHHDEHTEGVIVFFLPLVFCVVTIAVGPDRRRLRAGFGLATFALGVLEAVLSLVPPAHYGTAYYELGNFLGIAGIHGVTLESHFAPHALIVAVAGAVWATLELTRRETLAREL